MILLNVVWFGLVWFPLVTNHLPVKLAVVAMLSNGNRRLWLRALESKILRRGIS
jgi:hypothetical protein